MSFDLRKYLAEGRLFEGKLSNQEQDIVNDILSVNENLEDMKEKIKDYAKKGVLTIGIMAAVCGTVSCDREMIVPIQDQIETLTQEIRNDSEQISKDMLSINTLLGTPEFDQEMGKIKVRTFELQKKVNTLDSLKSININQ